MDQKYITIQGARENNLFFICFFFGFVLGLAIRAPTAREFCRNRVGSFQNKCTLPCVQKVMKYAPFWL